MGHCEFTDFYRIFYSETRAIYKVTVIITTTEEQHWKFNKTCNSPSHNDHCYLLQPWVHNCYWDISCLQS